MLRIILICLCNVLLAGCAAVPFGNFADRTLEDGSASNFVVWMLSDIHPKTVEDRKTFEAAVADVNENVGPVSMAIVAGDLLKSRSPVSGFDWFMGVRSGANIPDWFQIAGNHDARSGEIFYDYFPLPAYYAVEIGNLLFLCLSDQSVSSRTDISEDAFSWWQEMVRSHKDRIIVTVTHGQLAGSGLLGSSINSRVIAGSERFENVLKNEHVALWISGHTHLPQRLSGAVSIRKNLGGTCFLNVSSISDELFLDSESRLLYFQVGSGIVWIRSRNHTEKKFNEALDIPLQLGERFIWNNERPQVL
ncbi:MAG: putative phosphodiesterase [Desulforhopalus sp.]|jgi:predicted phosphodiesterase